MARMRSRQLLAAMGVTVWVPRERLRATVLDASGDQAPAPDRVQRSHATPAAGPVRAAGRRAPGDAARLLADATAGAGAPSARDGVPRPVAPARTAADAGGGRAVDRPRTVVAVDFGTVLVLHDVGWNGAETFARDVARAFGGAPDARQQMEFRWPLIGARNLQGDFGAALAGFVDGLRDGRTDWVRVLLGTAVAAAGAGAGAATATATSNAPPGGVVARRDAHGPLLCVAAEGLPDAATKRQLWACWRSLQS